ncbi:MAG: 16S rRNA processing protein RimM [Acidobacteria bacterium]|nr:16S rRNA processing protein RimM [Acidobacteriota bacterium]
MDADLKPIAIAEIVRTHGLRGEVVANPLTSRIERFEDVRTLLARSTDGELSRLELKAYRFKGAQLLLQFDSIDTIEKAGSLVGTLLCVPQEEVIDLEENEFFAYQLVGCSVATLEGRELGEVVKVLDSTGTPVLVVREGDGREYMIPFAGSICTEVDLPRRRIRVDPPSGLLEL